MAKHDRILEQLRRNTVALISLVVAVTSLSYNTWRNEKSEFNRNQREACFQLVLALGELQEIAWINHYDMDETGRGNPRAGWALVLTIEDLSQVLLDPVPESAATLKAVWAENWDRLGETDSNGELVNDGNDRIQTSIGELREVTRAVLASLD